MANFTGNGTKSMHTSVTASLAKLQTSYIDLLYVHWWDFSASIPELMQSLNHLVVQGKVLYLGVSDTPAWVVSKANQYARDHGLRRKCPSSCLEYQASRDMWSSRWQERCNARLALHGCVITRNLLTLSPILEFCVYQGRWSAANRDFERDIIPMCRDEGVSPPSSTTHLPPSSTLPPPPSHH